MIKIINEKWPSAIDKILSAQDKKNLARNLRNNGLDIENTSNELVQINSVRDPRLKDGVVIIKFGKAGWNENHEGVGVWLNGKCIQDVVLGTIGSSMKDRYASSMSWKNILGREDIEVYRMVIDPDTAKAMKDKRNARGDAKRGTQLRYREYPYKTNPKYTYHKDEFGNDPKKYAKLDKSGYYLPNSDKYERLLAKLKVKDADKILQTASDVYVKLSSQLMNRRGEKGSFSKYRELLRRIPELFYDLSNAMSDYEREKEKYGQEYADSEYGWGRDNIEGAIARLREYLNDAKEYINDQDQV